MFTLASYWDSGYNANIKIENTGETAIQNWKLALDFDNIITNIWNAEIAENTENTFIIKNVGWNQDIPAGSSIAFGISEEDYSIEYHVENDWGSGFYGSISVTNNTDCALEDWVLEFDFDREITELWDGVLESHVDNHYTVRNAEYNSMLAAGATVVIGIKGEEGTVEDEPTAYKLCSFQSGEDTEYGEVVFNVGADNVTNVPETQKVETGEYSVRPESPVREGYLFLGWYTDIDLSD